VAAGAGGVAGAGVLESATTGAEEEDCPVEDEDPEDVPDAAGDVATGDASRAGESAQADGVIEPSDSPEDRTRASETPSQGFRVVREDPRFDLISSPWVKGCQCNTCCQARPGGAGQSHRREAFAQKTTLPRDEPGPLPNAGTH
jgi:hypothetical protein